MGLLKVLTEQFCFVVEMTGKNVNNVEEIYNNNASLPNISNHQNYNKQQ